MESELVTDSENVRGGSGESPLKTNTQMFEECCPYYLAIGMTWEQFWNGDSTMVKFYRQAHKIKNDIDNQKLWLQGLYIYEVLKDFAPVLVSFPDKSAKVGEYVAQPFPLSKEESERLEEKKAQQEEEQTIEMLKAWADRVKKSKEGGE